MKTLKYHVLATAAALLAACAMTTAPAAFAGAHPEAAHDHGATGGKLQLDHGRKWSTDGNLRAGMDRIRSLVEPTLGAADAGKLSAAEYTMLAGQVETEIGAIVANCRLEPKADAMLHVVIGDIGAGADAMAGKNAKAKPQEGLVQVASAVNNYGRYFEHPGFKRIALKH